MKASTSFLLTWCLVAGTTSPLRSQELRERATLKGHDGYVMSIAFMPDGKTLASAGRDNSVRLWDVGTGEQRAILKGHSETVCCLAFTPEGKTLASGSQDKTVRLWDVSKGKAVAVLEGHPALVTT